MLRRTCNKYSEFVETKTRFGVTGRERRMTVSASFFSRESMSQHFLCGNNFQFFPDPPQYSLDDFSNNNPKKRPLENETRGSRKMIHYIHNCRRHDMYTVLYWSSSGVSENFVIKWSLLRENCICCSCESLTDPFPPPSPPPGYDPTLFL